MKSVGPELGIEGSASEHGANRIGEDGTVGTFTGTIFVRGVGSSGFDVITSIGEELDDIVTATKFAAKIEAHVTVGNGRGKTMKCEPRIQKIDGWCFGSETLAEQHTTMMVD
jgi:hypothetical protein